MVNYSLLATKTGIGLLALVALVLFTPSAGAFSWILYGNVTNAATCAPIAGAVVTSQYNGGFKNITNVHGEYRLPLGTGNWSVTVTANGYSGGSFLTPYYSSGAWEHNFSLVPTGGVARSPPCFSNTTVINTTKTTITPGVNPNVTTSVASTTVAAIAPSSGSSFPTTAVVVVIVIILVIAVIAYAMTRKKPPAEHHQKQQHTEG
jgi:hypothetical protein